MIDVRADPPMKKLFKLFCELSRRLLSGCRVTERLKVVAQLRNKGRKLAEMRGTEHVGSNPTTAIKNLFGRGKRM